MRTPPKSSARLLCYLAITLIVFGIAASVPASAQAVGFSTPPPLGKYSLTGCRNDGTITLPSTNNDEGGGFVCPDAAYTSGNLQKNWNELDLVPFRLTTATNAKDASPSTYSVIVAGEYSRNGVLGWDVIGSDAGTGPTLNPLLSTSGGCLATWNGFFTNGPSIGGSDSSIYRTLTITQTAGSTCVWDYYMRLALGSHLYPGSSLHGFMFETADFTQAAQDIPLPVNQIQPQQLSKEMTASQGADHAWTIQKQITGVSGLPNTCSTASTALQGAVTVTVNWAKQAAVAGGAITVTATITITNPASRIIDATVEDKVYEGTDATGTLVRDMPFATVAVPAASNGIAGTVVLTDSFTDTTNESTTNYFDVATATYTDPITGVTVPGNTQATASAAVQGGSNTTNETATIADVETLTDPLSLLSFEVTSASNSFGTGGSFTTPCALNTLTTSCTWTSGTLSSGSDPTDTGTLTFDKTIVASTAGAVTTATLADTATLTGSDGFSAHATASTAISANTSVSLEIDKTISQALSSGSATFTFHVYNSLSTEMPQSPGTIVFGTSTGTTNSTTIPNLPPDTYTVTEDALTGWKQNTTNPQTANLATDPSTGITPCSGKVSFSNRQEAKIIVQKQTVPSPDTTDSFTFNPSWGSSFTLMDGGSKDSGFLVPATYSVSETAVTGWTTTASCDNSNDPSAITLNAGDTVTCTFINTAPGSLVIKKVTKGADGTFNYSGGGTGIPASFLITTMGTTKTTNGGGSYPTITGLTAGSHSYSVSEQTPNNGKTGFAEVGTGSCDNGTPGNILIVAGKPTTCTFTNATAFVKVVKTFNNGLIPAGACGTGSNVINPCSFTFYLYINASSSNSGTLLETEYANAADSGVASFTSLLIPGQQYEMCELFVDAGWMSSLGPSPFTLFQSSGANNIMCAYFTPTAGQTSTTTFNVNNTPPPGGVGLTIGFWKNWASCTGGGQKHTLDLTLFVAQTLTAPGISVGNLALYTSATADPDAFCKQAVDVLSKASNNGTKFSSNPAYNLAAQLLGAELNLVAGAGSNSCVAADIQAANNLLTPATDGKGHTGVDFSKNFYANTAPKLTTLQTNDANYLQTQLNNYNNNLPVGCNSAYLF